MTFEQFKLSSQLLSTIQAEGYLSPTEIQKQSIPAILKGRDIIAAAQTGTGKTAGFALPIIEKLSLSEIKNRRSVSALILTPTRELAAQINDCFQAYGRHTELISDTVFGGVKINPQIRRLANGVDILVATPGRLLDLMNNNCVRLSELKVFVLDEADRMLDMGFIHDIKKIIKKLPKERQNLMFSATYSEKIRALAKSFVSNALEINVTPANTSAKSVKQLIHPVDKKSKPAMLAHLIQSRKWKKTLVFTKTKHGANRLSTYLTTKNISAGVIHGNKSQNARTKALHEFKSGVTDFLIATDIAARGIDIEQLPRVINFDLPNIPEDYIHRIGRTGRAGQRGMAISLVSADEIDYLHDIHRLTKQSIKREYVSGFEPTHELPSIKKTVKKNVHARSKMRKPTNQNRNTSKRRNRKPSRNPKDRD